MERMSQFQLLCFKLQTLLAQVEAQTSPEAWTSSTRPSPPASRPSSGASTTCATPASASSASSTTATWRATTSTTPSASTASAWRNSRPWASCAPGGASWGELNRQASELVGVGSKAMGTAGAQARQAVDRG
jgi:hypothetical protein